MLDGIDKIDWHQYSHAYGPADDVPELLRSFVSDDPQIREEATCRLFSNIWHQGTVYEATIYAVPFLIELLADPQTPDKLAVVCLLSCIADGRGYLEVHTRPSAFRSDWKSYYADRGQDLETELKQERVITNRVREAAKAALPLLVPYLSSAEIDVRSGIPAALAAYPELSGTYLPVLENALTLEQDGFVRQQIENAILQLRESSGT